MEFDDDHASTVKENDSKKADEEKSNDNVKAIFIEDKQYADLLNQPFQLKKIW